MDYGRIIFGVLSLSLFVAFAAFLASLVVRMYSPLHSSDLALRTDGRAMTLRHGGGVACLIGSPFIVAGVLCMVVAVRSAGSVISGASQMRHLLFGTLGVVAIFSIAFFMLALGLYLMVYRYIVAIDVQDSRVTTRSELSIRWNAEAYRLDEFDILVVEKKMYRGPRRLTFPVYHVDLEGPSARLELADSALTDHESAKWLANKVSMLTGLRIEDRVPVSSQH